MTSELAHIRDAIEAMDHHNQLEALRILSTHTSVVLNENQFGVHVNLSEADAAIVAELKRHVEYVGLQERAIQSRDDEQEQIGAEFFAKP